ncbi:universal stress protein [Cognatishimia sp. F0-27]|uniref:universal stress protein n=1 Tax=Cognatishimia sp. F0-27 TaxID=2816855 RepID=UPI001D0C72EC|nr:universal stress protein [Cognatishimia sp. F0-27]MCC1493166.1 universal stress protein [Cognatishimia sp. F0-27]
MHKHVLIPIALDHEGLIDRKIAIARSLLAEGGRITLLTVLENVPGFVAEFVTVKAENHLTAQVMARLEDIIDGAPDMSAAVDTGKPGIVAVEYAADHGCDLIVVGSHQPGIQDYFLGSTAARIARRARCAVYIAR